MPTIQQYNPNTDEVTQTLGSTKCGIDCIRFATDTFTDAVREELFYMRVEDPTLKADRVALVNLANGSQIVRDSGHRVIVHRSILHIAPKA